MFAFAPVVGILFDSYGPRRVLIGGTAAHVLGLLCLSFSREYYQIMLSQSVLSAVGASSVCYGANNAVATYFSRKRALALGMVVSGSSVGGTVLP
jgi:MFS family permease